MTFVLSQPNCVNFDNMYLHLLVNSSLQFCISVSDSPYHDVSGLPDPYLEQMEDEKPPQHMSLSYEESLESGYSTPNSRTRRVIREIIV